MKPRVRTNRRTLRMEFLEQRMVLDGALSALACPAPLEDAAANERPCEVGLAAATDVRQIESEADLRDLLLQRAASSFKGSFGGRTPGPRSGSWTEFLPIEGPLQGATLISTDNQVAGVEEGDFVQSDGEFLYVLGRDQWLSVIDIRDPGALQLAAKMPLNGHPQLLYLDGDRLTVIATRHRVLSRLQSTVADRSRNHEEAQIHLSVYDVSVAGEPTHLSTTTLDGMLVGSSRVGSEIRIVTSSRLYSPSPDSVCKSLNSEAEPVGIQAPEIDGPAPAYRLSLPAMDGYECHRETEEAFKTRLAPLIVDASLPQIKTRTSQGETISQLLSPEDVYVDSFHPSELIAISRFDMQGAPHVNSSVGIMVGSPGQIHSTDEHLYVSSYDWDYGREMTALYQFEMTDGVKYEASGRVRGHIVTQSAIHESDGKLSVATTQGWAEQSSNNVFVLEQDGEKLVQVGSLTQIAPGETIYSAHVEDQRALLSTFSGSEPLVTIDLTDPLNPAVAVEPNVRRETNSSGLLPGGYLIGVGASSNPSSGGFLTPQVSLIVQDGDVLKLIDREAIADSIWTNSAAVESHHAVDFYSDIGLLVAPFGGSGTGSGLYIFRVDVSPESTGSIELSAMIAHDEPVVRSVRVGDVLLAVSRDTVTAHDIQNLQEVKSRVQYVPPPPVVEGPQNDVFEVNVGSVNNKLDVLANDFPVLALQIAAISQTKSGGMIEFTDDGLALLYTPPEGFIGEDTFTYWVEGRQSAEVHVQVVAPPQPPPGEPVGEPLIQVTLELTDESGNRLEQVELGEMFYVDVYVDDLRPEGKGVFGAYLDVEFDPELVTVAGEVQHDPSYVNAKSGVASAGMVDEVGAFSNSLYSIGSSPRLLLRIPLEATAAGQLLIATNPADNRPRHEMMLFGVDIGIDPRRILYGEVAIEITNEMHNDRDPTDVNGDLATTPLDVLNVINEINRGGQGPVGERLRMLRADGEASALNENRRGMFYDVNNDGFVTAMDSLRIINRLNAGAGEGEQGAGINQQAVEAEVALLGPEPQRIELASPSHLASRDFHPTSRDADERPHWIGPEQADTADNFFAEMGI